MRFKGLILLLVSILTISRSSAQDNSNYTQSRVLILLDESSSMLQPWAGGEAKHKVAAQLIARLIDSVYVVNKDVEFSLRVFGNQFTVPEHNCTDTKNEVPFRKQNKSQIEFRLDDLQPLGVTAIAYSLEQAAENDLIDEAHNAYSIILITDGGESCGGDICGVMQKLLRRKIFFRPYILSLEDAPELRKEYACMGDYLTVTKKADIGVAVSTIVKAFRPAIKITKDEYKKIQELTSNLPSALSTNTTKLNTKVEVSEEPTIKPATTPKKAVIPVKDTVKAVLPKPVKDTVLPKPIKVSNIKVDEVVERPAPIKMSALIPSSNSRKFTTIPKLSPKAVNNVPYKFDLSADLLPPPPTPTTIKAATIIGNTAKYTVSIPKPAKQKTFSLPAMQLNIDDSMKVAPRPAAISITALAASAPRTTSVKIKSIKPKEYSLPKVIAPTPEVDSVPAVPKVAVSMSKLKPSKIRFRLLFKVEESSAKKVTEVPLHPYQPDPPAPASTPPPAPTPKPAPKPTPKKPTTAITPAKPITPQLPKTGEFKVERVENDITTVEIYLTNGKGKFYHTTPRITIIDAVSQKEIKKAYRTVNEAGEPDPLNDLAPGKYDLIIPGRDAIYASIEVVANKRNKVMMVIKPTSLFFYYDKDMNRPVKEYGALVQQRNTPDGIKVVQACTDRREYEPGNYFITINTLPEFSVNGDLVGNAEVGIKIPVPGFLKVDNVVNAVEATLFKEDGNKFAAFYKLKLSSPEAQHLVLLPGRYQILYNNGDSKFAASDRTKVFFVKSETETVVPLTKN